MHRLQPITASLHSALWPAGAWPAGSPGKMLLLLQVLLKQVQAISREVWGAMLCNEILQEPVTWRSAIRLRQHRGRFTQPAHFNQVLTPPVCMASVTAMPCRGGSLSCMADLTLTAVLLARADLHGSNTDCCCA